MFDPTTFFLKAKLYFICSTFQIQKYLKYCIDSDRELSCPHCLEDFDNPSALVKHLAVKHYANPLKEMFRFTGNCISCKRELGSPTQMLTHMALKHAVLYKVT